MMMNDVNRGRYGAPACAGCKSLERACVVDNMKRSICPNCAACPVETAKRRVWKDAPKPAEPPMDDEHTRLCGLDDEFCCDCG